MPFIYQPRRPRVSPLWQILTAAWNTFLARYEKFHRPNLGPLRPNVFTAVRNFLRCGDLASGFLRFHCPDCGHERLLAFTCKGRHLCPACHQRRVRQTADWIATADGLFTPDGRFHCMPAEDLAPAIELFRHRFLHALREGKHISPKKLADLLSWKHSGFNIHDGGEKPVPAHDTEGRKRLAEYLLRHPFSLQKITWNPTTQTVIKGGALPPGAHAKGTRKPRPSKVRQSILGIQLSPTFGMRPTARPRYLSETNRPLLRSLFQQIPWPNPAHPRPHHPPTGALFKSTIINRKSSSSPPRPCNPPVTCVPSGATSFSKSGEPILSNAPAAKLP